MKRFLGLVIVVSALFMGCQAQEISTPQGVFRVGDMVVHKGSGIKGQIIYFITDDQIKVRFWSNPDYGILSEKQVYLFEIQKDVR